jgi:hypothetical protein
MTGRPSRHRRCAGKGVLHYGTDGMLWACAVGLRRESRIQILYISRVIILASNGSAKINVVDTCTQLNWITYFQNFNKRIDGGLQCPTNIKEEQIYPP